MNTKASAGLAELVPTRMRPAYRPLRSVLRGCSGRGYRPYGCPEIFNTDQGSQFTADAFTGILRSEGISISMDGRGLSRLRSVAAASACGSPVGGYPLFISISHVTYSQEHFLDILLGLI